MRTSFMSTMIWITAYDNENVKLDIEAINVPRLLTNVSEQTWQGIPKGTKIGNLSLKTIRMSEVELLFKIFWT